LFPKSAREDSQDFIQHLALENNHGIGLMFSLYELCQTLCDKLTGILPRENVTRWAHSRSTRAIHCLTKTKFLSQQGNSPASIKREFWPHLWITSRPRCPSKPKDDPCRENFWSTAADAPPALRYHATNECGQCLLAVTMNINDCDTTLGNLLEH
jgi:hypothetical protein